MEISVQEIISMIDGANRRRHRKISLSVYHSICSFYLKIVRKQAPRENSLFASLIASKLFNSDKNKFIHRVGVANFRMAIIIIIIPQPKMMMQTSYLKLGK